MSKTSQDKILAEIFSAAGRHIIGKEQPPKFSGDAKQIKIVEDATAASRRLYEALCDNNVSIEAVTVMIENKKHAAAAFEQYFGRPWLL
jgi:hypothetical protein